MNMSPARLQELIARHQTMTKAREEVTFLGFTSDAAIENERVETRMLYRYADGSIEINYMGGKRSALQCGERVIVFGWQRMPCRTSARDVMRQMVEDARPRCIFCSVDPQDPALEPYCSTQCAINAEND